MSDPAEQAAREHPKHLHYQFCRIHSEHKPFCTCGLDDYILTRERAVRLEERMTIETALLCLRKGDIDRARIVLAEALRRAPAGDAKKCPPHTYPWDSLRCTDCGEVYVYPPVVVTRKPAGDAGQRCVICREPTQDAEDVMFTPHGEQVCSRCIADIQARRPEPDAAPGGGDE